MKLEYKVVDNKYLHIKEVLKSHFGISDRLLVKLKKNHKIFLNSSQQYVNHTLKIGDLISVNLDFDETTENIVPTKMNLNIIYEDDGIIILNKPANMPVHPSILHYENSLSNRLKYYYDTKNIKRKIRPVNRLDKDTSGIVVFAKNEYIQECLIKQMKNKSFVKEYYAILVGHLDTTSGTISAPISRKNGSIIEREINPNGDYAVTHYELIKNFEITSDNIIQKLSLVKFNLETGRTHQIRLHSRYINHPILGDSLYGTTSEIISRQALHAFKIMFIHPLTKKQMIFEIDLPNDMKKIINKKAGVLL